MTFVVSVMQLIANKVRLPRLFGERKILFKSLTYPPTFNTLLNDLTSLRNSLNLHDFIDFTLFTFTFFQKIRTESLQKFRYLPRTSLHEAFKDCQWLHRYWGSLLLDIGGQTWLVWWLSWSHESGWVISTDYNL